jgi:predicted NAD-dependent protein-ADP-ribosyltransferase YbiA (DUF1768 family)
MDPLHDSLMRMTNDDAYEQLLVRLKDPETMKTPADIVVLQRLHDDYTTLKKAIQTHIDEFDVTTDAALDALLDDESSTDAIFTSHLHLSPLHIDVIQNGIKYKSVMHAFQAHKVLYDKKYTGNNCETEQKRKMQPFANADLATVNLWGGSKGNIDLDVRKWDANKIAIMKKLLFAACEQHQYIRDTLQQIVGVVREDTLPDNFWGWDFGTGQNMIGNIWEEVKQHLLHKSSGECKHDVDSKRKRLE